MYLFVHLVFNHQLLWACWCVQNFWGQRWIKHGLCPPGHINLMDDITSTEGNYNILFECHQNSRKMVWGRWERTQERRDLSYSRNMSYLWCVFLLLLNENIKFRKGSNVGFPGQRNFHEQGWVALLIFGECGHSPMWVKCWRAVFVLPRDWLFVRTSGIIWSHSFQLSLINFPSQFTVA